MRHSLALGGSYSMCSLITVVFYSIAVKLGKCSKIDRHLQHAYVLSEANFRVRVTVRSH